MRRYLCWAILPVVLFNFINISLVMVSCRWSTARLTLSGKKTPRVIAFFLPSSTWFPTRIHSNAHISFLVANSFHMRGGKELNEQKVVRTIFWIYFPCSSFVRAKNKATNETKGESGNTPAKKLRIQGTSTRTGWPVSLSGNPDLKAKLFMGHSYAHSVSFSLTTTSYDH